MSLRSFVPPYRFAPLLAALAAACSIACGRADVAVPVASIDTRVLISPTAPNGASMFCVRGNILETRTMAVDNAATANVSVYNARFVDRETRATIRMLDDAELVKHFPYGTQISGGQLAIVRAESREQPLLFDTKSWATLDSPQGKLAGPAIEAAFGVAD